MSTPVPRRCKVHSSFYPGWRPRVCCSNSISQPINSCCLGVRIYLRSARAVCASGQTKPRLHDSILLVDIEYPGGFMAAVQEHSAPRNWTTTLMFAVTFGVAVTAVPWYGFTHGYHVAAWVSFTLLLGANGMAITCGYHRLFAHATYQAHPALKVAYLLFGAMALQNSALVWGATHRVHHRYIDDPERDPYCARRGFWFSHIGWMLRNYPSGDPDLKYVRELQSDPLVAFQHRHYLALALGMNIGLPILMGWVFGDILGTVLLAGVLRLVISHHLTFCINSLAHIIGSRPYSTENTARDNGVVALLTFGEGYHNFHHMFAHDYRNGVRWWQWDPSKWLIGALSWVGLTRRLKRTPVFQIQKALLAMQFT